MNLNCLFCHKPCQQWKSDKHLICVYCDVSYRMIDSTTFDAITFHVEREDGFYHLDLLIQDNKTEVFKINKMPANIVQPGLILSIKPVLAGVTPQNAAQKLMMVLLFS